MSIVVSLLSGKGGSGKTTIALSIAKMLSECGIKVLLIDADIATHGATYFFEEYLGENKDSLVTLDDLLFSEMSTWSLFEKKSTTSEKATSNNEIYHQFLQPDFRQEIYFVPSRVSFPNNSNLDTTSAEKSNHLHKLEKNIRGLDKHFDVVLFDCQAGYSELLNSILGISRVNLLVLEADAISAAACRVLYAQVSKYLENKEKRTYQLFNKITNEEYEVYKNAVTITMFRSLPPIMFNWEVRKAFAYSRIPELYSTDSKFGSDIHSVASVLFPSLRINLEIFTFAIMLKRRSELKMKIAELKEHEVGKKKVFLSEWRGKSILILLTWFAFLCSLYLLNDRNGVGDSNNFVLILTAALFPVLASFIIWVIEKRRNKDDQREEYVKLTKELAKIEMDLKEEHMEKILK